MNTKALFNEKSDIYAAARPRYPKALYEWLASVCPAHDAVWDVGCGNGQAAIDLRAHFENVQATDVSDSQIANAPICDGVTFSVQSAEATDFADQSFDAVCVAQALHWFDYSRFWPEVQRVLKPSGVFAAWGYSWPHINPEIDTLLETSLLSIIRPYWPNESQLLWDGYVDISIPLEPIETPPIQLSMQWSIEQFFSYLHSWSATRRCMDANGDAFFDSAFNAVRDVWGDEAIREINMDFFLVAGRKSAS